MKLLKLIGWFFTLLGIICIGFSILNYTNICVLLLGIGLCFVAIEILMYSYFGELQE